MFVDKLLCLFVSLCLCVRVCVCLFIYASTCHFRNKSKFIAVHVPNETWRIYLYIVINMSLSILSLKGISQNRTLKT